ncbi:Metacaspase-1 [Choanephora cucurbitarum]|uniref:Metacaspase-1 n=1 Tax=Choanephora cucurbitarum TaxID=101091 RepID=A0A1C7NAK6_9FUNG|nr:Metacaspase-1 [Choanephora cucurbitarum]
MSYSESRYPEEQESGGDQYDPVFTQDDLQDPNPTYPQPPFLSEHQPSTPVPYGENPEFEKSSLFLHIDPKVKKHGAPPFKLSNCKGKKKALLIGINYFGTKHELSGCINDVANIKEFIQSLYGFSEEDMVILTDDQDHNTKFYPTRENILAAMQWLVTDAQPNDSGHGGRIKDLDGDEEDGFDETIYPVDFEEFEGESGQIPDDLMHDIMVRPLCEGCRLTCIFDSCHSGTALDLPFVYSTKGEIKDQNLFKDAGRGLLSVGLQYISGDHDHAIQSLMDLGRELMSAQDVEARLRERNFSPADVIMFSGCKDNQTSADAKEDGKATGAMSHAFITTLRENPNQSYRALLNNIREILADHYSQRPQMSASHPIDVDLQFEFLFGKRKTPAELLRQHQRAITKAQRELDREREKLERQEKKLIADIKKSAKANQMGACKVMAKDLVRTRRNVQKFYQMKTQLQAVGLRIQTLRSSQQMAEAMKGATKAMGSMNRQMNLPQIQKIMMDFERESEMMDMKDEMMGDAIDDAFEQDEDEEESDEIVNKVLDDIGISFNQELGETPSGLKMPESSVPSERIAQPEGGLSVDDAALQARLDNLRRE